MRILNLLESTYSVPLSNLRARDVGCLNGYGLMQSRLEALLSLVTKRDDLGASNFGWAIKVFSTQGGLVVKRDRHFCAACFLRMRRADIRSHDLLAWQVADLNVCVVDKTKLSSRCPKCRSPQALVPTSGVLDLCSKCGCWLGDIQNLPVLPSDPTTSHQIWLAAEASKLIEASADLQRSVHGHEVRVFVREVLAGQKLTLESLATQLRISPDTLGDWWKGRRRPRVATWMRVCALLGVSPLDTLRDPFLAAAQMPLDIARGVWAVPRFGPRSVDQGLRERIATAVDEQLSLSKPSVDSIAELAIRLKATQSSLYHYCNKKVKKLAGRIRRLKTKRRWRKILSQRRSALRVLKRMEIEGVRLTRTAFLRRFMGRTSMSEWGAKELFGEMMRVRPSEGTGDSE
ncbi:helix-turn-helix domain-containing protein [Panacagrimonas perspica]|uniref:helix-turn-helix domain-containing protein n=1 Tax=Panacagrimonas perspica TaxID=381431 RepID=UPI00144506AE|nr:helix-turn-helix transcriptional regulator [Panacagrimonas perspica]